MENIDWFDSEFRTGFLVVDIFADKMHAEFIGHKSSGNVKSRVHEHERQKKNHFSSSFIKWFLPALATASNDAFVAAVVTTFAVVVVAAAAGSALEAGDP